MPTHVGDQGQRALDLQTSVGCASYNGCQGNVKLFACVYSTNRESPPAATHSGASTELAVPGGKRNQGMDMVAYLDVRIAEAETTT